MRTAAGPSTCLGLRTLPVVIIYRLHMIPPCLALLVHDQVLKLCFMTCCTTAGHQHNTMLHHGDYITVPVTLGV